MDTKLQDALKRANTEVENAGITDPELKKVAFSKAVDFFLHAEEDDGRVVQKDLSVNGMNQGNDDTFWTCLSGSSEIEIKTLKDIYSKKDEQLLLVMQIPGESKVDQRRNLAALVLFAYHDGLSYEWVPANLLAEAAKHSKLYSTSKFAKNLRDSDWFRTEGIKRALKYKLSGQGISGARGLLRSNS